MIEKTGNYWYEAQNNYDALVCTTNQVVKANGELVMGAGIAKDFNLRFPYISKEWGKRIDKGHLWTMVTYSMPKYSHESYLIALPTKTHWRLPSSLDFVVRSCKELRLIADYLDLKKVLMTRPGCGLGGLRWNEVKDKLNFLDDRFVIINKD